MLQITNPLPLFNDLQGELLDAGYIYIGTANADPQVSPISVYWDTGLTQPATQPIRTRGGYPVNEGAPANFYTGATDYSIRVLDSNSNLVFYVPLAAAAAATNYQPLDSNLTAISGQANAPFGLSLLTAATAAAAKALLGLGTYLATAGGTMTGNITRSGAGPHIYHTDSSLTSGRFMWTAAGAADPTSADGDLWAEVAS